MKRALAHLLLAVALLFAQQGALAHEIAHLFQAPAGQPAGDPGGKGKLAHSAFCAHWLSYTGLSGAAGSHGFGIASASSCIERQAHHDEFSPGLSIRAFDSRAPPPLS